MALTWDVTKIVDHQRVTTDPGKPKHWHPVTSALVWLALRCDFGCITAKNVDDVCRRISIEETLFGQQMVGPEGFDLTITRQDVIDHIGLTTNVGMKSFDQYMTKVRRVLARQAEARMKRDVPSCSDLIAAMAAMKANGIEYDFEDVQNWAMETRDKAKRRAAVTAEAD